MSAPEIKPLRVAFGYTERYAEEELRALSRHFRIPITRRAELRSAIAQSLNDMGVMGVAEMISAGRNSLDAEEMRSDR